VDDIELVEPAVVPVGAVELDVELAVVPVDVTELVEVESARNAPTPAIIKIRTIIMTTTILPIAS